MNAAANIFVGMSEAPLMIMPLIPTMTTSELHAVLVGGFATMAGLKLEFIFIVFIFKIMLGSVLATFIFFGVPANHLIAASVMAAPGALGFAKLLLPETHKSKTSWETVQNVPLPYVLFTFR
jgi:nucleoside permease NupC